MTVSVLLYALMVSTLVALVGLLVVDVVRSVLRWRPAPPDRHPDAGSARRRRPPRFVAAGRG
jgi:hypothetical protein